MQYARNNTTDYLVRFRNAQKFNEACDGILITKVVQEHGMKICFPLHNNGFDSLQEDEKKEAERQERKCYAQSYTWKIRIRPGLPTLKSVSKMNMC